MPLYVDRGAGVKSYSEEEIGELISCPKVITDPPKREMRLERGSRRNNMRLRSQSDDREFSVFMRINEAFQENFSIGLEYSPRSYLINGHRCLRKMRIQARWIIVRKFSAWYSQRVTSRRELCSQAKNRSIFQRRR